MSALEVRKGDVNVNLPSGDLRAIITEGKKPSVVVNPRRFMKATKQLATLGPASNFVEMIEKLFLSGADIFRLNFSHGEHSEKAELVKMIRSIEAKYNRPIAILADLQVHLPIVYEAYEINFLIVRVQNFEWVCLRMIEST
jgi:hypothetical protein